MLTIFHVFSLPDSASDRGDSHVRGVSHKSRADAEHLAESTDLVDLREDDTREPAVDPQPGRRPLLQFSVLL